MRSSLLAIILVGSATLAGWAVPVAAQVSAIASRSTTSRGLLAQADLARVRERRLADDREVALIAGYEQRIGGLQRQLGTLQSQIGSAAGNTAQEQQARRRAEAQAAAARRDLATARDELAALAETTARRDGEWAAERSAYRSEMEGMVAEATPEKLAALEKFADGDRVGAWPVLRELTEASVRARMAAAGARAAVEMRQLAGQRGIMRANGEATSSDVLAIWEESARLDPEHHWTQIEIARLKIELGDLEGADQAVTAARRINGNGRELALVADLTGEIRTLRTDFDGAYAIYEAALALWRELAAAEPDDRTAKRDVMLGLFQLSDAAWFIDNDEVSLRSAQEALDIARALVGGEPESAKAKSDLALALDRLGRSQMTVGQLAEAGLSHAESLELRRAEVRAAPTSQVARNSLAASLFQISDLQLHAGDPEQAGLAIEEALVVLRPLVAADPSSGTLQRNFASALSQSGLVMQARGKPEEALLRFDESIATLQGQVASGVNNLDLHRALAVVLDRKAKLQREQGNTLGLITTLREMLAERILVAVGAAPTDASAREVQLSHYRLGDAFRATGDHQSAVQAYQSGLALARPTLADPATTDSQRTRFAGNLRSLGTSLRELRDWDAAIAAQREALAVFQTLAGRFPDDLDRQRQVVIEWGLIGDNQIDLGQPQAALASFRQAREQVERIALMAPDQLIVLDDRFVTHLGFANAYERMNQSDTALTELQVALQIAETLAGREPQNRRYLDYLDTARSRIAAIRQAPESPAP